MVNIKRRVGIIRSLISYAYVLQQSNRGGDNNVVAAQTQGNLSVVMDELRQLREKQRNMDSKMHEITKWVFRINYLFEPLISVVKMWVLSERTRPCGSNWITSDSSITDNNRS